MLKRNSIAYRIWIAINLILLIGTFTFSGVYVWMETKNYDETFRNEAITVASTMSSTIGSSMLLEKYDDLTPFSNALMERPYIKYVIVRDQYGTIVNVKGETKISREGIIIEKIPLTYFQSKIGEVEMALSTETLVQRKDKLIRYTLTIFMIYSLFTVLFSTLFSRVLSEPIKKLVLATRDFAQGKREVAVIEGGPIEINELSQAFNEMAATIQRQENLLVEEIDKATISLSEKIKLLETIQSISHSVIGNNFSNREAILQLLEALNPFVNGDHLSIVMWELNEKDEVTIYKANSQNEFAKELLPKYFFSYEELLSLEEPLYIVSKYTNRYPWIESDIQSILLVPLFAQNKSLGTLCLGSKEEGYFDDSLIDHLSILTTQVALAIDLVETHKSLKRSAYHDYLTGLPNHRQFKNRLEASLQKLNARQYDDLLAVMFIDLDRFKNINDTFGHSFGDKFLIKISKILTNLLNENCFISRMGGDEFTIIIENIKDPEEATQIAKSILHKFSDPILLDDFEIHQSVSIGIALYPVDGKHADILIKKADTAMYRVKEQGKSNFSLYSPIQGLSTTEQFYLEHDLYKAISNKELTVYYQPKISLKTGEITGLEALVRWNHPERGIIAPGQFIPLAEETGIIFQIGEFVIREACRQMVQWMKDGLPPLTMSVNLSTKQFLQSNLVSTVSNILEETGLSPSQLDLEITESMTMNVEHAKSILQELKTLGVQISVDDFGTGYSSLTYLPNLPIDSLKIDQSFLKDASIKNSKSAIVTSIIQMAHNLKLKVVAEGVEDKHVIKLLKEHECDEIQGYYIGRPMTPTDFYNNFEEISTRGIKIGNGHLESDIEP